MATRLFSDDQVEALKAFPDIDKDELIQFFTLSPAHVAFVDPGRGRGPADRLGLAVQLLWATVRPRPAAPRRP